MDAADINRSIFNEEAASYDIKHRKLNERLTRELQARLDFIGVDWASDDEDSEEEFEEGGENKPRREVRMLDYACGTGMMSRAIAPYTTQCVGIDISEKMVAAYNARAENQGLLAIEMHAIVGELTAPTVSEDLMSKDLFDFDIAVVGGGFHHFADPELAAKRLVERLKPNGVLLIWDFLPHGSFTQGHSHHQEQEQDQHQDQHDDTHNNHSHYKDGHQNGHQNGHEQHNHGAENPGPNHRRAGGPGDNDANRHDGQAHRHGGHDHSHNPDRHQHHSRERSTQTQEEEKQEADTGNETPHPHVLHSVMHHGFSEERIRDIFTAAGAGEDFRLEVVGGGFALNPHHAHGHEHTHGNGNGHEEVQDSMQELEGDTELDEHVEKEGLRRQVFFARGTKAA